MRTGGLYVGLKYLKRYFRISAKENSIKYVINLFIIILGNLISNVEIGNKSKNEN